MSSNHLQSHSDPNYLLCMQNLRIDDSSVNNRRSNSLHSQQQQQQQQQKAYGGNGGGGVSLDTRGGVPQYDQHSTSGWAGGGGGGVDGRNHEQYIHQQQTAHQLHNLQQKIQQQQYQQGVHPSHHMPSSVATYVVNNSPTHSLSGSSHHSESPRTSLILTSGPSGGGGVVGGVRIDSRMAHMYENIDYYAPPISQAAGAEQSAAVNSAGYFESRNKKAQPQVPSNGISLAGRFAHTPQPEYECAPIYENIQANATGE